MYVSVHTQKRDKTKRQWSYTELYIIREKADQERVR